MADFNEQEINIKFCLKLGETFIDTHEMMKQVSDDQFMSHTHYYGWFKLFKDVNRPRQSANDNLHLVWPQHHLTVLMLHRFVKSCILKSATH